jgi:hypothetical protein
MQNAKIIAAFGIAAVALGACSKQKPADQNIAIDATVPDNQVAGNADIETLPADESSTTPSGELQNGYDNPDVNDAGNSTDSE